MPPNKISTTTTTKDSEVAKALSAAANRTVVIAASTACASLSATPCLSPIAGASSKLPLELTDRIIDFLGDDKVALATCSLVCPFFLKRCRHHRFKFVSLNQHTGEVFKKLLDASPDVGLYVRELHVSVSTFERPPTWVEDALPRIASKMPNVLVLHLKGNGEYKASPFRSLTSVRYLRLSHCEMYSMNEFVSIIGFFPSLDLVCLRDVMVGKSGTITPNVPALKRAPKTLEFTSSRLDAPMMVDWLLEHNLHQVESLVMIPLQKIAVAPVGQFFRVASSSVKHLKIAMVTLKSDTDFADELRSNLHISSLTNLRCLEFGSPAMYATQYGADDLSFTWVIEVLDQIVSPLESLTFSLWDGDLNAVTGEDWERITDILQKDEFKTLKKLTFHVWGRPTPCKTMIDTVKRKLATFDEQGLMHFDSVADPDSEC